MENHDNVTVLVGDVNPHLCQAIQGTFGQQGLTNVQVCATADDLVRALQHKFVDLIVMDHLLPGADLVDMIQRIRRQTLGKNPFVTIIATVGKTEAGSTTAIMDAGVDDVVPKPLTVDRLFKRISTLTQSRPPFIFSPSYVGPSRRISERTDGASTKTRDVPNTLRSRIIDMAGDREIERMVVRAAAYMRDDQFEAAVMEIDRLVSAIDAYYKAGGRREEWQRDLQRLIVASDAWRTWYDGASKEVVSDLAGMLIALAKRILETSPTHRVVEIDLLVQLSQAVRGSIDVDHREARFFEEITQIITRFMSQN